LDEIKTDVENPPEESAEKLAMIRRRIKESATRELLYDKGYYTCIVFKTATQCEEFLTAVGWCPENDAYWIDGLKLAEKMGVKLTPIDEVLAAKVFRPRRNTSFEKAVACGLQTFDIVQKKGGE
jgi:hypothetical protein